MRGHPGPQSVGLCHRIALPRRHVVDRHLLLRMNHHYLIRYSLAAFARGVRQWRDSTICARYVGFRFPEKPLYGNHYSIVMPRYVYGAGHRHPRTPARRIARTPTRCTTHTPIPTSRRTHPYAQQDAQPHPSVPHRARIRTAGRTAAPQRPGPRTRMHPATHNRTPASLTAPGCVTQSHTTPPHPAPRTRMHPRRTTAHRRPTLRSHTRRKSHNRTPASHAAHTSAHRITKGTPAARNLCANCCG